VTQLLGYPVVPILLLLIVAIVLTAALNFWISERLARWSLPRWNR